MRKPLRAIALLLLISTVVLSLFSCGKKTPQEGILISPESAYSAPAKLCAHSTFYKLLEHYTKQSTGVKTLPKPTQARLNSVAQNMAAITEEKPINELLFLEAMMALSEQGPDVIDELLLYKSTHEGGLSKTRALYLSLTRILDSEAIIDTLYRLLLYGYDYSYKDAMAKYNQYGYMQHLADAERIDKERTAFSEQIGREGFEAVFLHLLVGSDLFLSDALSSEQFSAFTDMEILLFLQSLELSETQIQDGGWELILGKILPAEASDSYVSKISAALLSSGDYKNLAAVMNDATALFAAVSDRLTEREIALLRSGDRAAAIGALMQRFTENDFARLSRITALSLDKAIYHEIALQTYGAEYAAYANEIQPIDMAALRASLGQSTFYESLEKYVAGISPAFSYGMRK